MKNTLMIALGALLLTACYKDNKEDLYQNIETTECDTSSTAFSNTIKPIFVNNCALSGCHVGSGPEAGLDLSTYNDIEMIANDGRLISRITEDNPSLRMPPTSPLPPCEIEQISKWVENGAQNN